MAIFLSAKDTSENALKQIGAFPSSRSAPDPGELRTSMQWLEMLLNYQSGIRPMAGFFEVIEIPLEAGIGDYILSDYSDRADVLNVFSVNIVRNDGSVDPLEVKYESDVALENLKNIGQPKRAYVSTDAVPVLQVFPTPTQDFIDAGNNVLRVRIQTYHPEIDKTGTGDTDLLTRPSWGLWLIKRLSYEIGLGPVRRLSEGELKRLQDDADRMEGLLLSRDARLGGPRPPVTEPMPGSYDL